MTVSRTAKTSLLSRTTHLRTSYCFSLSRRFVKPRISKPKGPKVTAFGQPFWICSKPAQNDRKSAICGLQIGTGQSRTQSPLAFWSADGARAFVPWRWPKGTRLWGRECDPRRVTGIRGAIIGAFPSSRLFPRFYPRRYDSLDNWNVTRYFPTTHYKKGPTHHKFKLKYPTGMSSLTSMFLQKN